MENVGKYLKNLREEKGLTIDEVCAKTKIHHSIIELIEADDEKALKEKGFSHLFLITYARFLNADMSKIEPKISSTTSTKKTPKSELYYEQDRGKRILISTKFFSITFIIILIIILNIFVFTSGL